VEAIEVINDYQGRKSMLLAVLVCLLASCSLVSCSQSEKSTQEKEKKEETEFAPHTQLVLPVVPVKLLDLKRNLDLPGELEAYQNVPVHAKVEGYISWIGVDRGSIVKRGQKMISIACPELNEKEQEARAKVSAAESALRQSEEDYQSQKSKLLESTARLDSDQLTMSRLQEASKTPGAIAQNDVDTQIKTTEADRARIASLESQIKAASALVKSQKDNVAAAKNVLKSLIAMRDYLTIPAPFDGVVTERNVHTGSIVAVDSARVSLPLVRVQQKDVLRLVVAVPEDCVAGLKNGAKIEFSVPAFLGKTFFGTVARLGYALDPATRTMPVVLTVDNRNGELQPGMFATVHWITDRPYKTMFVPSPAAVTTLKGTFVIRIEDGKIRKVLVTKGQTMDNLVEIVGKIKPGDLVMLKGTDEYKDGTAATAKVADTKDMEKAFKKSEGGGE